MIEAVVVQVDFTVTDRLDLLARHEGAVVVDGEDGVFAGHRFRRLPSKDRVDKRSAVTIEGDGTDALVVVQRVSLRRAGVDCETSCWS